MITGYQLLIGGVVLVLIGLAGGGHISIDSVEALALFLYLALLSSVAFALWTCLLYTSTQQYAILINPPLKNELCQDRRMQVWTVCNG